MSDLEIIVKALRDTAGDLYRYNDSLKDAGADALEALARNIEEATKGKKITAGMEGASTRDEAIETALKALKRFPAIADLPLILNALYDVGIRHGYQTAMESI